MKIKNQKGFAIPVVVLFLFLLAPLVLTFTLWIRKNNEHAMRHQLNLKQFYAAESAADFALYRMKKDEIDWDPETTPPTYQLELDGKMVVAVDVDFSGF